VFLAAGLIQVQRDIFKEKSAWSITLLLVGSLLMIGATRYSSIKMALARMVRKPS